MHWLLIYDYVDDYLERREALLADHLAHARAAVARGELALGGAFADEPPGAVIIFRAPSRDVVESFARTDPYVVGGLVKGWTVRQWTTVVGEGALTPL